jgi:hypothetical protein
VETNEQSPNKETSGDRRPNSLSINDLGRAGRRKSLTVNDLGDFRQGTKNPSNEGASFPS